MYVTITVIIIAAGSGARRDPANTMIAKNAATRAAPSAAPSSPLTPLRATLMIIMTAPTRRRRQH